MNENPNERLFCNTLYIPLCGLFKLLFSMGSELDCFGLFLAHMIRHKVTFAFYILIFWDKIIRKKAPGKKVVSRQAQLTWIGH